MAMAAIIRPQTFMASLLGRRPVLFGYLLERVALPTRQEQKRRQMNPLSQFICLSGTWLMSLSVAVRVPLLSQDTRLDIALPIVKLYDE